MLLRHVLNPIPLEEFRSQYVDRRWLLHTGPHDRFTNLISWAEVNRSLSSLRLPQGSRRVRLVKDGKPIPSESFLSPLHENGCSIRTAEFEGQLRGGATLVFDAVNELFPSIRTLMEDTERFLKGYAQVNLYAGWKTQKGFDLHWDDHDTMILQVYGRKKWTIYEPTSPCPSKHSAADLTNRPTRPPVFDGVLTAGSVLYMPRGWWHVAVPLNEPTLHLTFGISRLSGEHLMRWLTSEIVQHPKIRRYIPDDTGDRAIYLRDVRQLITEALADDCLDRMTMQVESATTRTSPVALPDAVEQGVQWDRDPVVRLAIGRRLLLSDEENGWLTVRSADKSWRCSAGLRPALSRLNDLSGRNFSALTSDISPDLRSELQLLLAAMFVGNAILVRTADDPTFELASA